MRSNFYATMLSLPPWKCYTSCLQQAVVPVPVPKTHNIFILNSKQRERINKTGKSSSVLNCTLFDSTNSFLYLIRYIYLKPVYIRREKNKQFAQKFFILHVVQNHLYSPLINGIPQLAQLILKIAINVVPCSDQSRSL